MPPYNLGKPKSPRSRGFLVIALVKSGKGRGMQGYTQIPGWSRGWGVLIL